MKEKSFARQILRLLQLLIVPFTFLLIKIAEKTPGVVESVYSTGIYPVIRSAVSFLTRFVPFSVAEILLYLTVAFIALALIVRIIRLIFVRPGALKRLISLIISVAVAAGYLFFLFYLMWGFNYYRYPVDKKLDLPEREYTVEELYSVCIDLAEKAKEARNGVQLDTSGIFCGTFREMKSQVTETYKAFGQIKPSFKASVPPAKRVLASKFLSKCGISGIYIFLTEEPCINTNEPFLYQPFSAAHETAHYLGYAREEDANFIAFMVCTTSGSGAVSYSAYMHALVHCGNALSKANKELYRELWSHYSDGMIADFENYNEYYDQYSGTDTWNTSNEINDNYLKFNDQDSGVLSYEEDVALILRYYDSCGFFR